MSRRLEFLPEALLEVSEATRYYEGCVSGLGSRFRKQVERTCAAIVENPLLCLKRRVEYYRVNLPGFPFYIAFVIRIDRILVAAVGHSSRHPDYWKRR